MSHATPSEMITTPSSVAPTMSPRLTPLRVPQSISGISCVEIRAATIIGTVAARAYQNKPPTSRTPPKIRRAFALQRAMAVPAARVGDGTLSCANPVMR